MRAREGVAPKVYRPPTGKREEDRGKIEKLTKQTQYCLWLETPQTVAINTDRINDAGDQKANEPFATFAIASPYIRQIFAGESQISPALEWPNSSNTGKIACANKAKQP